jgi:ClpP class serine protease
MPHAETIWCHEPTRLQAYCDQVLRASEATAHAAALAWGERATPAILTVDGDKARISISGTLSKRPSIIGWFLGFGGTSYDDVLEALRSVAENESIRELRLVIDSPGGNISGLDDVWLAVRALDKRVKVIAENRGLMASAAYWIASAADEIVATSRSALTGSIGVQMVTYDYSEEDRRYGVKEIRIVSSNAPKKNPDPATDEGRQVYQEELDAIERVFLSRVSAGRKRSVDTVIESFGQGAVLVAYDPDSSKDSALSVGMIDAVIGDKRQKVYTPAKGDTLGTDESGHDSPIDIETSDTGRSTMPDTLIDFLNANATARAEVEARETAARLQGREAAIAEINRRQALALATLRGEHPAAVRALAVRVIAGEADPAALEGALAVLAAQAEGAAAAAVVQESAAAGSTPAAAPVTPAATGEIATEVDHQAAVQRLRAAQGAA